MFSMATIGGHILPMEHIGGHILPMEHIGGHIFPMGQLRGHFLPTCAHQFDYTMKLLDQITGPNWISFDAAVTFER